MCGIAGVVDAERPVERLHSVLATLGRALAHRGPDDAGVWSTPDGLAGFAHRRLSIIDLTPGGHQPMSTPDGRLTITFNGEIYNYRELRADLERDGPPMRTRSDTEVILRGHERYGVGWADRLRGMFAYAVWDAGDRTLSLVRDPFGVKPLYYAEHGGRLAFASEVQALVSAGLAAGEVDPDGLYGYLRLGSVPEPLTLLRGVRCLPAGHHAVWRAGRLGPPRQYWDLSFGEGPMAPDRATRLVREALVDSLAHHFVSDVPVGIFLSGGIDSTALVALAHATGQADVRTFSIGFPGARGDESPAALRTAGRFGTLHREWPIDAATGRRLFDEYLAVMDQPTMDGLNTFAVSGLARQAGVKVVMSGLGGDELFGGYPSFRAVPRLAALHRWTRRFGLAGLGSAVARQAGSVRLRRLGGLLDLRPGLDTAYTTYRGVFTRSEALTLGEAMGCPLDGAELRLAASAADPTAADTVSRLELTTYMRNQLLRDSDVMSMAHGLELRVPFVDRVLASEVASVPAALRLRPGKRLLVEAVPEIPREVAEEPKKGFQFPFEQWLDGSWRETFVDVERGSPVRLDTWYRKWTLLALNRWLRRPPGRSGRIGADEHD